MSIILSMCTRSRQVFSDALHWIWVIYISSDIPSDECYPSYYYGGSRPCTDSDMNCEMRPDPNCSTNAPSAGILQPGGRNCRSYYQCVPDPSKCFFSPPHVIDFYLDN